MWEWDHKEGWAPKNWCFKLWHWRRLLRVLDCKEIKLVNPKGNQPWVFTGRTDAKAEAPILGHLMQRTDSLEKTLTLGKIEGRRRRGWQRMRCLDGITNSMDMGLSKVWVLVMDREAGVLQSMESQRVRHNGTDRNFFAFTKKILKNSYYKRLLPFLANTETWICWQHTC